MVRIQTGWKSGEVVATDIVAAYRNMPPDLDERLRDIKAGERQTLTAGDHEPDQPAGRKPEIQGIGYVKQVPVRRLVL